MRDRLVMVFIYGACYVWVAWRYGAACLALALGDVLGYREILRGIDR